MAGILPHQLLDGAREAFFNWDEELEQKLIAGFLPMQAVCDSQVPHLPPGTSGQ